PGKHGAGLLPATLPHRERDQSRARRASVGHRRIGAGRDSAANPHSAVDPDPGELREVAGRRETAGAPEEPDGYRDWLRAEQLGGDEAVRELRLPVDRQQRGRATYEDDRNRSKKL